jgi:hypothetical protein
VSDLKAINTKIHEALAQALLDKVRDGSATAADLNVARQYLKDNNVSSTVEASPTMNNLVRDLPFTGDEASPRFRN